MPYVYDYPRPCVSCESVVFDLTEEPPQVLLVLRKNEPFKNLWCIPGGFMEVNEELVDCAARELYEETGVDLADDSSLRQIFTKGRVSRDPRDRIIAVVYTAVIEKSEHTLCANDDAEDVAWFKMDELPTLATDHLETIRKTLGEVYHDRS